MFLMFISSGVKLSEITPLIHLIPYYMRLPKIFWERSGRVLGSRPRGCGFEPHQCHCVVSLSKNIDPALVLVQPRKTHPFITERLLMGRKESNQTKPKILGLHNSLHAGYFAKKICVC